MKERARLDNLLKTQKISEQEYKTLVAALETRPSPWSRLFFFFLNPFQKIAGIYALLGGVVVLLLTSSLGVLAKVYFPGVLSVINAEALKNAKLAPGFYLLAYQNLVIWLVLSLILIGFAKIFRQKGVRLIDFLGTVGLARFPFLILTAAIALIQEWNPRFMALDLSKGLPLHPSLTMLLFSGLVFFCACWQIATYFFAFKESSGLRAKKLWFSYCLSLILADLLSSPLTMLFL